MLDPGLLNRMRTLFADVVDESHIENVTGIAAPADASYASTAQEFVDDATILHDRQRLFALDGPVPIAPLGVKATEGRISTWLYGATPAEPYSVLQFVPVAGTAVRDPGIFRRRRRFVKYRPFFLEGLADSLRPADDASPPAPE